MRYISTWCSLLLLFLYVSTSFPSSEEFDRHSHIDEDYFAEQEQLDLASIADTNFKASTDMLTGMIKITLHGPKSM